MDAYTPFGTVTAMTSLHAPLHARRVDDLRRDRAISVPALRELSDIAKLMDELDVNERPRSDSLGANDQETVLTPCDVRTSSSSSTQTCQNMDADESVFVDDLTFEEHDPPSDPLVLLHTIMKVLLHTVMKKRILEN
jgi:hypothetical protein